MAATGPTVTAEGIGHRRALEIFEQILVPATRAQEDPLNLAYIPSAPTRAAVAFDLATSVANIFGGHWETGAGAIHAENQVLGWLAGLLGWPATSGGTFVSGGTTGNLSALVAARHTAEQRRRAGGLPGTPEGGWVLACSAEAHSSVRSAAHVMGVPVLDVPGDDRCRLTGPALSRVLDSVGDRVFAVVASAGTTNAGIVDDLVGVGAGLRAPRALAPRRRRLRGRGPGLAADPPVVRRHRAGRLVHRRPPQVAVRAVRLLRAAVPATRAGPGRARPVGHLPGPGRPAGVEPVGPRRAPHPPPARPAAVVQPRRPRDGPVRGGRRAQPDDGPRGRGRRPGPRLPEAVVPPELSVLLFERVGWGPEDYMTWSKQHALAGDFLCLPTRWQGEWVLRLAFVNPATPAGLVVAALDTLAEG